MATKKSFQPKSPIANIISGFIFGAFLLVVESDDFGRALRGGVFFALAMTFIDYSYVYYSGKRG